MTRRLVDERDLQGEATVATRAAEGFRRFLSAALAPAAGGLVVVRTTFLAPLVAVAQERSYDGGWGMHPMWWAWGAGGVVMMLAPWALHRRCRAWDALDGPSKA